MSKVGINLLWLIPGVVGGSEEYTVGLLHALAACAPSDLELTVFAQPNLLKAHPELAEVAAIVELPRDVASKPLRFGLECSWLAVASRRQDVMHHAGGVAPIGGRQPVVVTVHDIQPLELPANFSAIQRRWFGVMLPGVAKRADRIVTPSRFTGDRLTTVLDVEPGRISVVPPVHLSPGESRETMPGSDLVPDSPYLLYPAVSHRHKRHIDAVAALDILRQRYPDLRLVFTGRPGSADADLRRALGQRGLAGRVELRGRVSPEALDQLLRGAEAMVFPSVYEGFGNPILEAMARNTPVIAANATAIPEVAGGAALLFQAGSPRSLAEAIDNILSHPAEADRLRAQGRQRALGFSQQRASDALVSAYRDVGR